MTRNKICSLGLTLLFLGTLVQAPSLASPSRASREQILHGQLQKVHTPSGRQVRGASKSASVQRNILADATAQSACTAPASSEPIAVCYDDSNYDAGSSVDAEIVWEDTWTSASSPGTLITDIVPYSMITDASWLTGYYNYLEVFFDVNGDSLADVALTPNYTTLYDNQSTNAYVWYWSGSQWVKSSNSCSARLSRMLGYHAAISGTASWWQYGVGWSCMLGGNTTGVLPKAYMSDYYASDYAPDSFGSGYAMYFNPDPPTNISVVAASQAASVSWSQPGYYGSSPVSSYVAAAFTDSGLGSQVSSCTSSGASCTIGGLTNGVTYAVAVRALNGSGLWSDWTYSSSVTPITVAPSAPRNVTASISSGATNVQWLAPLVAGTGAVVSYQATAFSDAGLANSVATCSTSLLSCTISPLTNLTQYWVAVRATNSGGAVSPWSAATTVTPNVAGPSVPRTVSATAGNTMAVVQWLAPTSVGVGSLDSYQATAFTDAGLTSAASSCMTSSLTCTISNLENGHQYWVAVKATNTLGGVSLFSSAVTVTPAAEGLAPTFDAPIQTIGGFTVNVTNYDGTFGWVPTVTSGSVSVGNAVGPYLPITVTGLRGNRTALLTITSSRLGYTTLSGTLVGQALPPSTPSSITGGRYSLKAKAARISWYATFVAEGFEASYQVRISRPNSKSFGRWVSVNGRTATFSKLSRGKRYTVQVRAINDGVSGAATTLRFKAK